MHALFANLFYAILYCVFMSVVLVFLQLYISSGLVLIQYVSRLSRKSRL